VLPPESCRGFTSTNGLAPCVFSTSQQRMYCTGSDSGDDDGDHNGDDSCDDKSDDSVYDLV
jgi:hypothetical protein